MKIRIIEIGLCNTADQVLLFVDRNEDGEDFVRIIAWHINDEDDPLIQSEKISFPNSSMMEQFIKDYTVDSANEFANSFGF